MHVSFYHVIIHFKPFASQRAIRTYVRRVQTPRMLLRFLRRWNDTLRRSVPQTVTEQSTQPQPSDILVPSIHHMHAEAAVLFNLRRLQRFLSKILRSWRYFPKDPQISWSRSASEANSHAVDTNVEVKDSIAMSIQSTFGDSSALGKLLFEKVVAALDEEVKATLQFG